MTLGYMQMPADFKYRNVFLRGKPVHRRDGFSMRHPGMACSQRAKIFSPFDALKGFSEAVAAKDVLYTDRPELSEEEQDLISRRLFALKELTGNSRLAKANRVQVRIVRFVPCTDPENAAFGCRGQVQTVSGICRKVDADAAHALTVGQTVIRFEDILSIQADGVFHDEWELDAP